MWLVGVVVALGAAGAASISIDADSRANSLPKPTTHQSEFMDMELTQFMHFGLATFWDPPVGSRRRTTTTYHNCHNTEVDHSSQTGPWYPCLDPIIFNPSDLNVDDWMAASAAMGMKEIVLTAHHEGGFALWPSAFTNYSIAKSLNYKGGKGDVLREFADACNRWGIKIAYYLNVQNDGYQAYVAKVGPQEFIARQVGMVHEVLTQYGPVHRFWFDGTKGLPDDTNRTELWERVYNEIHTTSPGTMISGRGGDICGAIGSLYYKDQPQPNSSDLRSCGKPWSESGQFFQAHEMHGLTIQQGKDGNSDELPTYWFWHPSVGHANASRVFDSYLVTVGHGATLNMNIPPDRSGRMNASVAAVMRDVGEALNRTFASSVVKTKAKVQSHCVPGVVELQLPEAGEAFDYIMTMEDLSQGQRIANYSVEFQRAGSSQWEVLVPPVTNASSLKDRPDGHDPRDQYVGHKRIDIPEWPDATAKGEILKVRFTCLRSIQNRNVLLRSFSLHKKTVPWERAASMVLV